MNAINDSHREKLFYSVQYKNDCLAASDVFHMYTESISSLCRCLKNVVHETYSKNEWLLLSAIYTVKFGLIFILTLENAFS